MSQNLIPCAVCSEPISRLAKTCPKCRRSQKAPSLCLICMAPVDFDRQDCMGFEGRKQPFRYVHDSCFGPIRQQVCASFSRLKCPDCGSVGFENYFLVPSRSAVPRWFAIACPSCGRPDLGELWKPVRDTCRFCRLPIVPPIHGTSTYTTDYTNWTVHEICFRGLRL
jgi:hypothetical protein